MYTTSFEQHTHTHTHTLHIHTSPSQGRRLVSDFGMLTAIVTMVIVAYLMRNMVAVEVLVVPPNYSPSNPLARGWFINPFNGKVSLLAGFGAFVPALLVSV